MSATAASHPAQRPLIGGSYLRTIHALRPVGLPVALAAMPNRASTLLRNTSLPSGDPVGESGAGIVDRPNHHDHAFKIAVGYTASRHMLESATFGVSSQRPSLFALTLIDRTERSREFGTQLLPCSHPLSGFFLLGPETAICAFERFCCAASRDPGSGTSLRRTIP